jgi:hypothetical protein
MEDIGYQIEPVSVTRVASEDIDKTFRSSCIGKKTNPKRAWKANPLIRRPILISSYLQWANFG